VYQDEYDAYISDIYFSPLLGVTLVLGLSAPLSQKFVHASLPPF
jgi:hypothetical protein